ncbi:MAG: HAD family hydrolase [Fuerstiella sp.]|nr:HAD family hydrolase [Fuerstiella sp.]
MTNPKQHSCRPTVLATDLDGTLIPLPDEPQNQFDLMHLSERIRQQSLTLVYVTGRHLALTLDAIRQHRLPPPDWLIADVGTSMFRRISASEFVPVSGYFSHLQEIQSGIPLSELGTRLTSVAGVRLQEPEKQGEFKLSLYVDADRLQALQVRIEAILKSLSASCRIISSVDPFNGNGLIDLLPASVSKAYALDWWIRHRRMDPQHVVFAGDSGNDLAALTAGYRAIVVGNAASSVVSAVKKTHRQNGWNDRLYLARQRATSGVLEGCRWFDVV